MHTILHVHGIVCACMFACVCICVCICVCVVWQSTCTPGIGQVIAGSWEHACINVNLWFQNCRLKKRTAWSPQWDIPKLEITQTRFQSSCSCFSDHRSEKITYSRECSISKVLNFGLSQTSARMTNWTLSKMHIKLKSMNCATLPCIRATGHCKMCGWKFWWNLNHWWPC